MCNICNNGYCYTNVNFIVINTCISEDLKIDYDVCSCNIVKPQSIGCNFYRLRLLDIFYIHVHAAKELPIYNTAGVQCKHTHETVLIAIAWYL